MEQEVSFRSGKYDLRGLHVELEKTAAGQAAGGSDCLSRQKSFDPLIPVIEF
jgi:hypothetical protein